MIDEQEYVRSDTIKTNEVAEKHKGLSYVIVRTHSAGVFAGYLEEREGQEVKLLKARRLWYWEGAATLSQLAIEGVKKPEECKFTMEVNRVELLQAIEIIECTKQAQENINEVAIWKE